MTSALDWPVTTATAEAVQRFCGSSRLVFVALCFYWDQINCPWRLLLWLLLILVSHKKRKPPTPRKSETWLWDIHSLNLGWKTRKNTWSWKFVNSSCKWSVTGFAHFLISIWNTYIYIYIIYIGLNKPLTESTGVDLESIFSIMVLTCFDSTTEHLA